MSITIRFYAAARSASGVSEFVTSAGQLTDILQEVIERFPQTSQVLPICTLLNDGMKANGFIQDGSLLEVLPPYAGG